MEEAAYHAISVACPWISWIGLIFHSVDTDSCFVVGSGGMHKEQIYFKDGQLKVTPLQDLTLKELSAISKQAGCVWFQSITQQNVGRYLFSWTSRGTIHLIRKLHLPGATWFTTMLAFVLNFVSARVFRGKPRLVNSHLLTRTGSSRLDRNQNVSLVPATVDQSCLVVIYLVPILTTEEIPESERYHYLVIFLWGNADFQTIVSLYSWIDIELYFVFAL